VLKGKLRKKGFINMKNKDRNWRKGKIETQPMALTNWNKFGSKQKRNLKRWFEKRELKKRRKNSHWNSKIHSKKLPMQKVNFTEQLHMNEWETLKLN
jgi:hypothetical protein